MWKFHGWFERHTLILGLGIVIMVSIGGLIEIAPLFYIQNTIEKVDGMRPYTPLELAGRNIYIREGCYLCHSQMIRPLRDEVERYGHYSLAAESMYDHPFQWGSKRIGPDLARVGGKYSDAWQVEHLKNPRSVVPESVMPPYQSLAKTPLDYRYIGDHMKTLKLEGVPYTADQIANAKADLESQASNDASPAGLNKRYGTKFAKRNFTGADKITEMDALVAYLQMLGTLVDFKTYHADAPENQR